MKLNHKISLIFILSCVPLFIFGADNYLLPKPPSNKPIQVLFIGNSYTYYNDLPGLLSEMSAINSDSPLIETEMYAVGSASLMSLWEEGRATEFINGNDWDYVVLQENSNIPSDAPWLFTDFLAPFNSVINKTGARTLLFSTWAHKQRPTMYQNNNETFQQVSKEFNIPLVPVGLAWNLAFEASPNIQLHLEDGTHPNRIGTYTAACVFYRVLLQDKDSCPIVDALNISTTDIGIIQIAVSKAVQQQYAIRSIK